MKKMNKKGFTLAELLIVVAIIAVLVAVAIPVFSAQLEKSKEATDVANLRSAYAEAVADAMASNSTGVSTTYNMNQATGGISSNVGDELPSELQTAMTSSNWGNKVKGETFQVSATITDGVLSISIS